MERRWSKLSKLFACVVGIGALFIFAVWGTIFLWVRFQPELRELGKPIMEENRQTLEKIHHVRVPISADVTAYKQIKNTLLLVDVILVGTNIRIGLLKTKPNEKFLSIKELYHEIYGDFSGGEIVEIDSSPIDLSLSDDNNIKHTFQQERIKTRIPIVGQEQLLIGISGEIHLAETAYQLLAVQFHKVDTSLPKETSRFLSEFLTQNGLRLSQ